MNVIILSKFPKRYKRMKDSDFEIAVLAITLLLVVTGIAVVYIATHPAKQEEIFLKAEPIVKQVEDPVATEEPAEEEPAAPILTDEEMIAMVVMAESGNQDMLGKVAVASVVLNRCDYFGLTVESVVKAKGQFSYPYYGTVSEDCYRAVEIAQNSRDLFPATMLYFRNTHYHTFGIPYEQIGDHYFSLIESEE